MHCVKCDIFFWRDGTDKIQKDADTHVAPETPAGCDTLYRGRKLLIQQNTHPYLVEWFGCATGGLGDVMRVARIGFTCGGFVPKETEYNLCAEKKVGLPVPEARSLVRDSEKAWKEALINKYGITAEWLKPAEAMEWLKAKVEECEKEKRFESLNESVAIGVAGPSGGGKTKNALDIVSLFASGSDSRALIFSEDEYYRNIADVLAEGHNLDEPAALRLGEEEDDFAQLVSKKGIERERYDKVTGTLSREKARVDPKDIVVAEGLFALRDGFADRYDIMVFVYAPFHAWFIRRLMRDVKEGKTGWSLLESTRYMLETVKPMYERYVEPTMRNADLIIVNDYDPCTEAERCKRVDVQKKYMVKGDVKKLAERLDDIGAERQMYARQVDRYYTDGSFGGSGEIVRIREEGGKTIFAYKGPKKESDALERQKLEFEISANEKQGLLSIYTETGMITKDRTLYSYNGATFSLDTSVTKTAGGEEVPLGNFVEVHLPKGKDERAVMELLSRLRGFEFGDASKTAYSEM